MGRYGPCGSRMLQSLLACHREHAEVCGTMSGRRSLCAGSGLKGFGDFGDGNDAFACVGGRV